MLEKIAYLTKKMHFKISMLANLLFIFYLFCVVLFENRLMNSCLKRYFSNFVRFNFSRDFIIVISKSAENGGGDGRDIVPCTPLSAPLIVKVSL